mgnify:CR=1 FL=1
MLNQSVDELAQRMIHARTGGTESVRLRAVRSARETDGTPRGRVATRRAHEHLGIPFRASNPQGSLL